uniref:CREB/ATF bZIP transcription factor n=1 Tax=Pogona vitticeps TaxID=103695 RepID=A0A6J0V4T6_9SAUR
MRHSLAQLLATSSREVSPRVPAAACSFPREAPSGRDSPGEAGNEAAPRHEEAAEAGFLDEPDEELLFPPGLELDDWLEAAVAETRPEWDRNEEGSGSLSPTAASESPPPPPLPGSKSSRRPGSNRLKAAAAARLNRQKKKQYVLGLETRLQGLAAENRHLRDRNRGLCRRLRDLERETSYLRAVLANQSALGRLLSHLAGDRAGRVGLRISTSLFEDPPRAPSRTYSAPAEPRLSWERSSNSSSSSSSSDHDYALPAPEEEEEEEEKKALSSSSAGGGGICLHVDRDQVSVEFCSVCARRAASSAWAAIPAASPSFAAKIFSFRCLPCQAPLCRG